MLPGVYLTVTILEQRGPWRRTKCRVGLENVISRTKFQKVREGDIVLQSRRSLFSSF